MKILDNLRLRTLAVLTRFCRHRCVDIPRCTVRVDESATALLRRSCPTEPKGLLRLKLSQRIEFFFHIKTAKLITFSYKEPPTNLLLSCVHRSFIKAQFRKLCYGLYNRETYRLCSHTETSSTKTNCHKQTVQRTSLDLSLTLNKSHVLQNRTRQMRKNIQIPTKPKKKIGRYYLHVKT